MGDQGVETVAAAGDQYDSGAAAGEFSGRGVTDAAAGAGDDGDGAGELLAHEADRAQPDIGVSTTSETALGFSWNVVWTVAPALTVRRSTRCRSDEAGSCASLLVVESIR